MHIFQCSRIDDKWGCLVKIHHHKGCASLDSHEQIVEIMGNASCQSADRLSNFLEHGATSKASIAV